MTVDVFGEDILNEDDVIVAAEIDTADIDAAGVDTAGIDAAEVDAIAAAGTAPAIRIVKGNPTASEVAALVAVLTAAAGSPAPALPVKPPELFGSYEENLRHEPPTAPRNFVNARLHR